MAGLYFGLAVRWPYQRSYSTLCCYMMAPPAKWPSVGSFYKHASSPASLIIRSVCSAPRNTTNNKHKTVRAQTRLLAAQHRVTDTRRDSRGLFARYISAPAFPIQTDGSGFASVQGKWPPPSPGSPKRRGKKRKREPQWFELWGEEGRLRPKRFGRKTGPVGTETRQMVEEVGVEEVRRAQEAYREGTNAVSMSEAMMRKLWPIEIRPLRLPISISTLSPEKLQVSDYITLPWSSSCWITTVFPRLSEGEESQPSPGMAFDHESLYERQDGSYMRTRFRDSLASTKSTAPTGGARVEQSVEDVRLTQSIEAPRPPSNPAYFTYRKWDFPRFVRGRDETRRYRRRSRRHMMTYRKRRGEGPKWKLQYYKFPYPKSLFESRGGFLYLYKPPSGAPQSTAGLRFRITNDRDPKSFVFGKDLTYGDVPWTIPLFYGPIRNKVIRRLIFKDNLLPPHVIQECGALRRKAVKLYTRTSRRYQRIRKAWLTRTDPNKFRAYTLRRDTIPYNPLIYAIGQPFAVDLSRSSLRLFLMAKSETGSATLQQFKLQMPKWRIKAGIPGEQNFVYRPIFSGLVQLCFQVLAIPNTDGKRVIVLRVIDVVKPVVRQPKLPLPKDIELPVFQEGSLFPSIDTVTGEKKPMYWPRPHVPEDPLVQTVMSLPDLH